MPTQDEIVVYIIEAPVTVECTTLQPGRYPGIKSRIGADTDDGQTSWGEWEYTIDTDECAGLHCSEQVRDKSIKIDPLDDV